MTYRAPGPRSAAESFGLNSLQTPIDKQPQPMQPASLSHSRRAGFPKTSKVTGVAAGDFIRRLVRPGMSRDRC
jgi:hypothetical protein